MIDSLAVLVAARRGLSCPAASQARMGTGFPNQESCLAGRMQMLIEVDG